MSSLETRPRGRVGVLAAATWMALLVAVLWLLEGIDQANGHVLDTHGGIRPRSEQGLWEVFTAPFLHGSWAHLVSNTVPFFVLGVIVLLDGVRRWLTTTLLIVVTSGAAVWLLSPTGSVTLGASGVVFGWLAYLIARGFYTRAPGQIALSAVVFFFYGGALLGVLPTDSGISWQAHLGGLVGGMVAASLQRRRPVDPRWH
jgi:membrane associated rhomboid family serine protease